MGAITRDLFSYAVIRNETETITLVSSVKTLQDDGSFTLVNSSVPKLARVVPLTRSEINRLLEGGITINKGYSISFAEEITVIPDYITLANGLNVKVVDYAVEEGCSVFVADLPALGSVT
jgi:hypothetical protein